MVSDNGFNIYDKVYNNLLKLGKAEIEVHEFYRVVENMKIPKEKVVHVLEKQLLKIGLTVTQVDRICNNLSYKLRWTRRDARNVEKHLREEGLVSRISPFKLSIKQP